MPVNSGKIVPSGNKGKPATKKRKVTFKQSPWFVTINTNTAFDEDDPDYEYFEIAFVQALKRFWSSPQHVLSAMKVYGNNNLPLDYDTCRFTFEPEIAPATKYVHAHGIVVVIHHSCLHLVSKAMQNNLLPILLEEIQIAEEENEVELPKPSGLYCNFVFIKEWTSEELFKAQMKEYISKNKKFDIEPEAKMVRLQKEFDRDTNFIDNTDDNVEVPKEEYSNEEPLKVDKGKVGTLNLTLPHFD